MGKIIKYIFDLLFALILGLFFIVFLLKIICCKTSENKDEWLLSFSLFLKTKALYFKNQFAHFTESSYSLLHETGVPLIRNAYSEISNKVITKKK